MYRDILKKERAYHRLKQLAMFKEVPIVSIPEIPKNRTLFPNTKNDYWQEIERTDEENKTSCLYELDANGLFSTHIHLTSDETCTLKTKGAKVEWVTEEGIFFYEYPATFTAKKGVQHALKSLVNFSIEIEVDWHPKMKGWIADFK